MSRSRLIERAVVLALVLVVAGQQVRLSRQEKAFDLLYAHTRELTGTLQELQQAERARPEPALRTPLPGELFVPSRAKVAAARPERALDGDPDRQGPQPLREQGVGARRFAQQRALIERIDQRMPENPGAVVLNRLYDAADQMAEREQWDDRTYNDVADVFEQTTTDILDLWDDLKQGEVAPADARDEALALRESAQTRLATILGDDGLEELREHVRSTAPAR